jgi:hypothetical protein
MALQEAPPKAKRDPAPVGDSIPLSAPKTSATHERGSKKGHCYKPLRKEFRHNGFNYRLIAREGDAAIYEQTWCGCSSASASYEVVRIRRREGVWIGSTFVEPAEVYPNSEAWGVDGFTLTDKDAAFVRRQMEAERSWPGAERRKRP